MSAEKYLIRVPAGPKMGDVKLYLQYVKRGMIFTTQDPAQAMQFDFKTEAQRFRVLNNMNSTRYSIVKTKIEPKNS